jgi:hypothetical protein
LASSKEVFHSEQNIGISSQSQETSIPNDGQLYAAFDHKPWASSVLQARRDVVLSCLATAYGRAVETTRSAMNERRFQNQKQFAAGFLIFAREQNVLEISVQPLLVAQPITVSFASENNFRIAAKNEPAARL